MTTHNRKAGRPKDNNIDVRQKLIEHARELFTSMPYDKVSNRQIANQAGVNIAMIHYYFGNKEGLFETVIRETINPMKERIHMMIKDSSQKNFLDIMRTYYHEMFKIPQFPRLVFQIMHMDTSDTQRKLLEKVFADISQPMQMVMFDKLVNSNILKPDVEPELCKVSYFSLMAFPFIAPPGLLSLHGIELSEDFLNRLLEHNIKLMTDGMLQPKDLQD
ncbi:TetR/AcrR family transcriptional regulator [Vibrio diazotrophicus]|uniref:TetR family transcriptional regulator n=1 Tax=Vibrio diazotrophicus TaxID=685 RepID=A0A329EBY3_VIBDI|nr:TetR/AcrR family transcriptional regulator [Vibrio diazotrophicus]MCZ4372830.1 TetR/AcrR family transcriptional regulator [Vibrio diazotrophicus]RAS66363.1 TetR family transcriptional regulator [Vibrio diazotrophicus]